MIALLTTGVLLGVLAALGAVCDRRPDTRCYPVQASCVRIVELPYDWARGGE